MQTTDSVLGPTQDWLGRLGKGSCLGVWSAIRGRNTGRNRTELAGEAPARSALNRS